MHAVHGCVPHVQYLRPLLSFSSLGFFIFALSILLIILLAKQKEQSSFPAQCAYQRGLSHLKIVVLEYSLHSFLFSFRLELSQLDTYKGFWEV